MSLPFILRNLPPGIRRAALNCRYIWSCRPGGRTRWMSPYTVVGSFPAFSPLPPEVAVVFCYGLRKIAPPCDFRSRVPFPVRTFLTPEKGAADRPSVFPAAKIEYFNKNFQKIFGSMETMLIFAIVKTNRRELLKSFNNYTHKL